MTLREIAKRAKVSPSTVSRVINNKSEKCASPEVRDTIWKIVQETGYMPNRYAQSLKLQHQNDEEQAEAVKLACVFARVKDVNDQFFSALYRMIEQEAYKNRFLIQYSFSFAQLEGANGLKTLQNVDADGIIILGRCSPHLMQRLKDKSKNIVYAALNSIDFPVDQVTCNGYKAAQDAVSHLYDLGHRTIGYIGETSNESRYKGYCDKLEELGIPIRADFIAAVSHSPEGGYQGAQSLTSGKDNPDAIFCCNDITAVGAISALKAKKLHVPADISVISIDNIEMARYVSPMLTTVSVPLEEMGKMALMLLKDRMAGGHRLPVKLELPFQLIKRESCKARK